MTAHGRVFTDAERRYLSERRLGRIATVGKDGTPHVAPVGWSYDPDQDVVEVGGHDFARTKKYHDVKRSGRAAIVIDDLASVDPWRPRGIEVRGKRGGPRRPAPDPHPSRADRVVGARRRGLLRA